MKHAKMLGLLAIAATALMAFAGSASATTLTSPKGTALGVGALIKSESEGATKLDGTIVLTCQKSKVEGKVTTLGVKHGSGETTGVTGTIETLTFEECGNNTVTVVDDANGHNGTLTIKSTNEVTSTGAEVTALTHNILGTVHCIYKTNNTKVGTLTESNETAHENEKKEKVDTTATLDIGSAGIPQVVTDGACKNDAVWTGSYKVTSTGSETSDLLYVD